MKTIPIEIVYANTKEQCLIKQQVPDNSSVQKSIENSGILSKFSEINLAKNTVGIFGKKVNLSQFIKSGDRVEIYRPLIIDPMSKRRLVAKKQKVLPR
jgi:uncharacterized protein